MKPLARRTRHTALGAALVIGSAAHAAAWDESVHGDLADSGLAPSVLALVAGTNLVRGSFGAPDNDYLAIEVPAGHVLSALRVEPGWAIGGVRSFIGVQAGPVMTVPPDTDTPEALLGWSHVQFAEVGTDLLPDIGRGPGAIGFQGPLPEGRYTFWIQDTSTEPGLAFALDFEVSAVPEPAPVALGALGMVALMLARSRGKLERPLRVGARPTPR